VEGLQVISSKLSAISGSERFSRGIKKHVISVQAR
jgi:hypothetical protein